MIGPDRKGTRFWRALVGGAGIGALMWAAILWSLL